MKISGSRYRKRAGVVTVGVSLCVAIGATALTYRYFASDGAQELSTESVPALVRISPGQYENSIKDVFGTSISVSADFEPEIRVEGLLAIGAAQASVSDAGFQQYDAAARGIASQVVDERHRGTLIPCRPSANDMPDEACAQKFLARTGRLLWRRPLENEELQAAVQVAVASAKVHHDFYAGLATSIVSLLDSPYFVFRHRVVEPDPKRPNQYRLNAFSKASQLSFFLWNTTPDDDLLTAAESGELHTEAGLRRQVGRLMSSPRLEDGLRAFFGDFLGLAEFETLSKDPSIFPNFTQKAKADAREQTLRTLIELLLKEERDYRDVFTTHKTFLTRSLAALYGVPLPVITENGAPESWQPYHYSEEDPHVGILTHASFVALHSHAGKSSPTLRGKALRELLLCQVVPPPPGNVDFTLFNDPKAPQKTARQRLSAHATQPACAGCHKITDPIGLALENFDSAGGYRVIENDTPIDVSGEINGIKFDDVTGLANVIHDDPAASACIARKLFAFGAGYLPPKNQDAWVQIQEDFAADGYRLPKLLRQIATSDLFYLAPTPPVLPLVADSQQLVSTEQK